MSRRRRLPRLSETTLGDVRIPRAPDYDRGPPPPILHLGMGAFARAHLGVYADDLTRNGWPALIRGVSIRSARTEKQLAPQDGLYTVAEREPGTEDRLRVICSLTSVRTGPRAAFDALCDPAVRMVTLTITEKGYDRPRANDEAGTDSSVPAILARALAHRRDHGLTPPIVASLDNLQGNGTVLRRRVREAAEGLHPTLSAWIEEAVAFPSSVVDRLVPATTEDDLRDIQARLGVIDRAAVATEHHRSWVISQTDGLPPFADVGVQVVSDLAPFERRKLWLLNGPHSAIAYSGLLAGAPTIASALDLEPVRTFVRRLVDDVLEVAALPPAVVAAPFAQEALRRFANPSLGHTCLQVGEDGSRKLPQRILPVIDERRRRGLDTSGLATVMAIWIASVGGLDVRGGPLPRARDVEGEQIRTAASHGDLSKVVDAALGADVDSGSCAAVVAALERVVRDGVDALGVST